MIRLLRVGDAVNEEAASLMGRLIDRGAAITEAWAYTRGIVSVYTNETDHAYILRSRALPAIGSFLDQHLAMYETLAALYTRGDLPPEQLNAIYDVLTMPVTNMSGEELE